MPKLRIKGAHGATRVEVPPNCTLGQLCTIVSEQVLQGSVEAGEVRLSLNKKEPLDGGTEQQIKALGVCGGDLLWVLNEAQMPSQPPAASPAAPVSNAAKRTRMATTAATSPNSPNSGAASSSSAASGPASMAAGKAPEGSVVGGASGGTAMEVDARRPGSDSDGEAEAAAAAEAPPPPVRREPTHLQRVLAGGDLSTPSAALVCAAHAAMLEGGFVPIGGTVAHGAGAARDAHALPGNAAAAVVQLRYCAAADRGASNTAHGDGGRGGGGAVPQVAVVCSRLGGYLTVAGSVGGGPVRSVTLDASAEVAAPALASRATAQSDGAGAGAGAGATAELPAGTHLPDKATAPAGAESLFVDLRRLWRRLKDEVVLPLAADAARAAGREPAHVLLALPGELLDVVLRKLQAEALAAASCTCSALRHAAGADVLWRPLFAHEFDGATCADEDDARRHGWKWVFVSRWRQREARRRYRSRHPAFMPYPCGPRGRNPWMPTPFPRAPLVGGDVDRLPGPFLGGGPGDYRTGPFGMGSGGTLGTAMFGGPPMGGGMPFPGRGGMPGRGGAGGRRSDFRLL